MRVVDSESGEARNRGVKERMDLRRTRLEIERPATPTERMGFRNEEASQTVGRSQATRHTFFTKYFITLCINYSCLTSQHNEYNYASLGNKYAEDFIL